MQVSWSVIVECSLQDTGSVKRLQQRDINSLLAFGVRGNDLKYPKTVRADFRLACAVDPVE